MLKIIDPGSGSISDMHWKTLRYFNLYRMCIAGLLFVSAIISPSAFSILNPNNAVFHLALTCTYVVLATASFVGLQYFKQRFNTARCLC